MRYFKLLLFTVTFAWGMLAVRALRDPAPPVEPVVYYRDCKNVAVLTISNDPEKQSAKIWTCHEWGEPYTRDSPLTTR